MDCFYCFNDIFILTYYSHGMSLSISKRFCHIQDCIDFHCKAFLFTGINSPVSRYAIAFKSRWMSTNASIPYYFWLITLMACLNQFLKDFAIYRIALTSNARLFHLLGYFTCFFRYAIDFKSRWIACSATMLQNFWHVTIMACLH